MQLIVAITHLCTVLQHLMLQETQQLGLTPEDALLMAWLSQEEVVDGSHLARRVVRKRQSVHRALKRLEKKGLVLRLPSSIDEITVAWALTEEGEKTWFILSTRLAHRERKLAQTENLQRWLTNLECLVNAVAEVKRGPKLEDPPETPETAEWDL
jgi:DNA-binding MarR family transcriptional regulator